MRHSDARQFRHMATPLTAADLRAFALFPEPAAEPEAEDGGATPWRGRSPLQRLRAMLAFTPHMFWSCDLDTGEEHYSRQWLAFTGVDAIGLPGGVGRIDLVHPEDRERARLA